MGEDRYQKQYSSNAGLFVSVSGPDLKVDGSGTVLRKDSSWKLWYDEDYKKMTPGVTIGFVWNNSKDLLKCGYGSDADSGRRFTSGLEDRCGLHHSVGFRHLVVFIIFAMFVITGLISTLLQRDNLSAFTNATVVAGVLILGLWFFQWYKGGWAIFETSTQCSQSQECIDTVLRHAKEVYGCPNGNSRARRMFAIISAVPFAFTVYTVCAMYSLPLKPSITVVFAAILLLWAFLGYTSGDPVWNPFGVRKCTMENEFVINRAKDAVSYDEWKAKFQEPDAIALIRKSDQYELSSDEKQRLLQHFDDTTPCFYITYTSNDSEPEISKTMPLDLVTASNSVNFTPDNSKPDIEQNIAPGSPATANSFDSNNIIGFSVGAPSFKPPLNQMFL